MAEKLVAFAKLDQYMADRANLGSSQFRAALQGLLPQSSATPSASVAQIVQQRADGVTVHTQNGKSFDADYLLVAIGRGPATANLGYE